VEENHEALSLRLQELEVGLGRELDQLLSSAAESLRSDDHELQELASLVSLEPDDEKELEAKVTALTEKLIDLNREEIECRLNRVYLQGLAEQAAENKYKQDELEEKELEQDLKSLHMEVPDVAAMSVVQEFKSPLLQALTKQQNRRNEKARHMLEEVCAVKCCLMS
jgi:Ulp1 family protease